MNTRIRRGDNVYVRQPYSFISDCVSITGDVVSVTRRRGMWWATVDAYVARVGGGYPVKVTIQSRSLGFRIGTPISKLSGRPGHPGYAEFVRIANSWGYP